MRFIKLAPVILRSAVFLLLVFLLFASFIYYNYQISCSEGSLPSGNGTFYQMASPPSSDPSSVVAMLISHGIVPEDVWFKPYSSQCCAKSSNICLQAIVRPALVVKLAEQNPEMEKLGFMPVARPDMGFCPSHVIHCSIR